MCGVLAGGVGTRNEALDSAFAFQQLLGADTGLQVVHITELPMFVSYSRPCSIPNIAAAARLDTPIRA